MAKILKVIQSPLESERRWGTYTVEVGGFDKEGKPWSQVVSMSREEFKIQQIKDEILDSAALLTETRATKGRFAALLDELEQLAYERGSLAERDAYAGAEM